MILSIRRLQFEPIGSASDSEINHGSHRLGNQVGKSRDRLDESPPQIPDGPSG